MGNDNNLDLKIAARLKTLRLEHNLSLDQLAGQSGISRATLSRVENAEVSPTAVALGKLASIYQLTMSRLMAMMEQDFIPLVTNDQQQVWHDPETGFSRTMISPPAEALHAEMLECSLPAGQTIAYANVAKQGLEHHIYMLDGELSLTVDGQTHQLKQGDCLRYQLYGASQFTTPSKQSAKYILTLI